MPKSNFSLLPIQVAEIFIKTENYIRIWCQRYPSLAFKDRGRWRIDPAALGALLRENPNLLSRNTAEGEE